MGLEVDSSAFIAVERAGDGLASLRSRFPGEDLVTSAVVISELLHGLERAAPARFQARRSAIEAIIRGVPVLQIDLRVARVHSVLWAELERSGQRIGAHDLWIAATAVANQHGVLTLNVGEFRRVPGLRVETLPSP